MERIGNCEYCGLVDHHLIDGLCPACHEKAVTCHTPAEAVMAKAIAILAPIAIAAMDCGMLTERMADQVRSVIEELEDEIPIVYEAAWPMEAPR